MKKGDLVILKFGTLKGKLGIIKEAKKFLDTPIIEFLVHVEGEELYLTSGELEIVDV
jgi:ribosomal protein L24